MLQNVELIVDNLAARSPLLDTQAEGSPHIHTRRLDAFPLPRYQLASEELIQGLLLPFLAEPQRLSGLQVADHREKFALLALVYLVDSHLPQEWLATTGLPTLQVSDVDGSHCTLSQAHAPSHLSCRCAFASFAHLFLEALAVRRLA